MQSMDTDAHESVSHRFKTISENRYLFLLIVINLLLRLPRVPGVLGNDAFVVIWMGQIISEGDFINWTVTPFSFLGMDSFSGYPIGIPLIIGFMFWLGLSIESAVLFLSLFFCVIGIFGAYTLGKEVFSDKPVILLFTAAYSLSHIFLRFTYYTISPRGPFLAILPWFLWASILFIRKRKLQDGVASGVLLFTLFLTHGLALVVLVLYLSVFAGYLCIIFLDNLLKTRNIEIFKKIVHFITCNRVANSIKTRVSSIKLRRVFMWTSFLSAILISYLVGLIVLPVDPGKTTPFLLANDSIIGVSFNLIIDYGLRLGIVSIFMPIGIFASFNNDFDTNKRWFHFVLVPMLTFTIPKSPYTSLVFLPILIYYSVYGFETIWKKLTHSVILISLLALTLLFGVIYNSFIVSLPVFPLLLIIISGIALVWLTGRHLLLCNSKMTHTLTAKKEWSIIILVIICFSVVTTDGLTHSSDVSYMTEQEKDVAEFLSDQSEAGIVFVYNQLFARRLQAYGVTAIRAYNEPIGLHEGWITRDQIIVNTQFEFTIESFLIHGDFFHYNGIYPEISLFNILYGLDVTNRTEYSVAMEYQLRFVIVEKIETGYNDMFGGRYCPLLHSAPITGELVIEYESFALFRLF